MSFPTLAHAHLGLLVEHGSASVVGHCTGGGAFWGCWCLHTIALPLADHVLTIALLIATRAELTARCEGSHTRFGWCRCSFCAR